MATQQSFAKKGIRADGNGGRRRGRSRATPVRLKPSTQVCETIGASSRVMSLAPMRPQGVGVSACVLHVFETFGCGGFLLDRERELLFLNPTGMDCLGDGLMMRGKRVAATDRDSDLRLQSLIGAVLSSTETAYGSSSVWLQRESKLPLAVHLVRLGEEARPALKAAHLLLVAFDPERCQPLTPNMLIDLFGLTPAEASIALGIASGWHLAEIAAARRVKIGTVRVYSKTAFRKTGTRGQAELAALLTRLAFLARHPRNSSDGRIRFATLADFAPRTDRENAARDPKH
jgi:DNA-binding CsgD family transcriptional regulator